MPLSDTCPALRTRARTPRTRRQLNFFPRRYRRSCFQGARVLGPNGPNDLGSFSEVLGDCLDSTLKSGTFPNGEKESSTLA